MSSRSLSYAFKRFILRQRHLIAVAPRYDLRLKVVTEDVVGRHIYKYGAHEPAITDMLRRELTFSTGDVALDVGANIGWYTLVLSRIAGDTGARVIGFEPDPANFALLVENVNMNGANSVSTVQKGVADRDGTLDLHLFSDRNRGRHSVLPLHEGEAITIETVTLDGFWRQHVATGSRPAFLKMDIEGFELVALRGARDVLAQCPFVMLEFSPRYMKSGGLQPAELPELMRGAGFHAQVLEGNRLVDADIAAILSSDRHVDLFWRKR